MVGESVLPRVNQGAHITNCQRRRMRAVCLCVPHQPRTMNQRWMDDLGVSLNASNTREENVKVVVVVVVAAVVTDTISVTCAGCSHIDHQVDVLQISRGTHNLSNHRATHRSPHTLSPHLLLVSVCDFARVLQRSSSLLRTFTGLVVASPTNLAYSLSPRPLHFHAVFRTCIASLFRTITSCGHHGMHATSSTLDIGCMPKSPAGTRLHRGPADNIGPTAQGIAHGESGRCSPPQTGRTTTRPLPIRDSLHLGSTQTPTTMLIGGATISRCFRRGARARHSTPHMKEDGP